MAAMMTCCRHRAKYIDLLVTSKTIDTETGEVFELSPSQCAELAGIEEIVPMNALIVFRQLAAQKSFLLNKSNTEGTDEFGSDKGGASDYDSSNNGWWSWITGSSKDGKCEEDALKVEEPTVDLAESLFHSSGHDALTYTIDFELLTRAKLSLAANDIRVATLDVEMHLTGAVRSSSLQILFSMTDLLLVDDLTIDPVISNIVIVRGNEMEKVLDNNLSNVSNIEPQANRVPFSISLTNKSGKTTIKISALPLEICLNKHCIQQILSIFNVTDDDEPPVVIDKRNRQFQSAFDLSINKDSRASESNDKADHAGVLFMAPDSIDIIVDIESPKIIMPEDSSRDIGCLVLDTGHLLVNGSLTAPGMSWIVSLRSINANMPRKVQDIGCIGARKKYLIRPFGVNMVVQNIKRTKADMTVEIEITPNIRGEIDAYTLSRLMHTIEVITSTFDMDDDNDIITSMGDTNIHETNIATLTVGKSHNMDAERVCLDIKVSVNEIALVLIYEDSISHSGVLRLSRLSAHIEQRPFDSVTQFDLGSLSIEDSIREESQKFLLQTPTSNNGVYARIIFIEISNEKSPHFKAHQKEVDVHFATLKLHLDDETTRFLRPFYEVVLGKRLSVNLPEIPPLSAMEVVSDKQISEDLQYQLNDNAVEQSTELTASVAADNIADSIHVVVALEVISIEVLRSASACCANGRNAYQELESVASLGLKSLRANVTLTDILEYDVTIHSVNIVDTREVSREYKFRTLFCPESRSNRSKNSDNVDNIDNDQIVISYREIIEEKESCQMFFDIILNDLTGYISMDTILDVLDVTLANSDAVLDLVSTDIDFEIPTKKEFDGDGKEIVSETKKSAAGEPFTSLRVHVNVPNPRLYFLEDPTSNTSKAIVCRCGIDYTYYSEDIVGRTLEVNKTMDLSVIDIEMFVLFSMTKWNPRHILSPMNVDIFTKSCEESGIVTSDEFSLSIDSINARVSLSDVILAQTILLRRTLRHTTNLSPVGKAEEYSAVTLSAPHVPESAPTTALTSATAYSMCCSLNSVYIVIINDFKGRNLPIARGHLSNLKFAADGVFQDLRGTGSFSVFAESFNSDISEWETILDRWQPSLQLSSSGAAGLTLSLIGDDTFQLTLSSSFLKTILQAQALLFVLNEGSDVGRGSVPTIVFKNELGIPVMLLLPSKSHGCLSNVENLVHSDNRILFRLDSGDEASIFTLNQSHENAYPGEDIVDRKSPLSVIFSSAPSTLGLHIVQDNVSFSNNSEYKEECKVMQMPLYLNRIKNYEVFCNRTIRVNSSRLSGVAVNPQDVVLEEVFENQRYVPLTGAWTDPFLVGDPCTWTTREGMEKNKDEFKLPSHDWEWQDDWKIDRWTYKTGVDIDDDGFEYSLRFGSFVEGKPRLCSNFDCVRRRRWIRSRRLKIICTTDAGFNFQIKSKERSFLLNLIWDSHLLENGSKEITIRSNFLVHNRLPYDICLQLHSDNWEEEYLELGPVGKDSVMAVPLLASDATSLRVKPIKRNKSTDKFKWSQAIPCALQTLDYTKHQDILCVQHCKNSSSGQSRMDDSEFINNLPIRSKITQENSFISVSFTTYVELTNLLPCTMRYRCFNSFDLNNVEDTVICAEEGSLIPGEICKLTYVSLLYETFVTFKLGNYSWSPKILLTELIGKLKFSEKHDQNQRTDILHEFIEFPGEEGIDLLLRMDIQSDMYQGLTTLSIYSSNVLVDRTGLGLSVRSNVSLKNMKTGRTTTSVMNRPSHEDSSSNSTSQAGATSRCDSAMELCDFFVRSENEYTIDIGNIGSIVHSDRSYKFTYLPPVLCGQTFISTPCEDRALQASNIDFMRFRIKYSAVVLILINKLVSKPPRWIRKGGYRCLVEQAIASGSYKGAEIEIHYSIYGKLYSPHAVVNLGSNFSRDCREMYSVFVVGLNARGGSEIVEQVTYNRFNSQRIEAARVWSSGGSGLTLFDTSDDCIGVGTGDGLARSKRKLKLNTLGTSAKGNFEIYHYSSGKIFQLAYNVQSLPGAFFRTTAVTVMPQYCIVNCLGEAVEVRQQGSALSQFVEPCCSEGWHKNISQSKTAIQIRFASTLWSHGCVDVNEIGATSLLLPVIESKSKAAKSGRTHMVVNVEVKVADSSDMCLISVTIWESKSTEMAPLSIRNETRLPISVKQNKVVFDVPEEANNFEMTVPPLTWTRYGWADPEQSKKVLIAAGDAPFCQHTRTMTISTLKLNSKIRLPVSDISLRQQVKEWNKCLVKEVVLTVETSGSGVVVRIYEQNNEIEPATTAESSEVVETGAFCFVFKLATFGISIVADVPDRREILSLYTEQTNGKIRLLGNRTSFEFSAQDMQIDNYCETCVYPVMFHRVRSAQRIQEYQQDDPQFIQFSIILEQSSGKSIGTTCNYVSLRVLEFAVEVDSGTLQIFLQDFLQSLNVVSRDQALALQAPEDWMDEFNEKLLAPESRLQLVNNYKALMVAQQPKIVFENVVLHPIKMNLTFVHTELSQHRKSSLKSGISDAALNILASLVEVESMSVKLKSFIVSNAVETVGSLLSRVEGRIIQSLRGQLAQMAGSLTILGSPVGLVRNIGTGVEAFFYEPYQGLVLGPQDFVLGIGRGTTSLVAGFVSGTLNSTAALVNTASSGISYLSGDTDFIRDRSSKMQKRQASKGGALDGIKGGGDLVVSGFTSGLKGLIYQPLAGAQSSGAKGFVKGLGLGVAGAVVKPTLGIADGFTSAATGISNEVGFTTRVLRARPARAFQRSDTDPTVRVLTALNVAAAEAQEIVRMHDDTSEDEYIANYKLDNDVHVILSKLKLMIFLKVNLIRLHFWSEISHCFFRTEYVGVVLYSKAEKSPVKIFFKTKRRGLRLYEGLVLHSYLMGNPSSTLSLEQLNVSSSSTKMFHGTLPSQGGRNVSAISTARELSTPNYVFGSAEVPFNEMVVTSEKQLLVNACSKLYLAVDSNKKDVLSADDKVQICSHIDKTAAWLVHSHVLSSNRFSRSRCCVVTIINDTSREIIVNTSKLIRGRMLHTVDVPGYDKKSNVIRPNFGFAIFFGCGDPPSFYDSGSIEFSLSTNAFDAFICEDEKRSVVSKVGAVYDYKIGFIEKSSAEWWSKYCIFIHQ